MAKKGYRVESPEGAAWAASQTEDEVEEGGSVELELTADQERAVVAAGWLSAEKKSKGGDS